MQTQPADPNAAQPPPQAQPPVGSVPQPGADDVLYQGIAKHSANIGTYLMWTMVCVLGGVFGYFLMKIQALSTYPLWVLALVGVPMLLWAYLVHIKSKFRITRRRVEVERGVLTTKLDTLELWRVLDIRYERNILDQMFDNAKIILVGTDQTDPELLLYGMPNHRQLFEKLRDAVQFARHSNKPMELAGHGHGDAGDLLAGGEHHH